MCVEVCRAFSGTLPENPEDLITFVRGTKIKKNVKNVENVESSNSTGVKTQFFKIWDAKSDKKDLSAS